MNVLIQIPGATENITYVYWFIVILLMISKTNSIPDDKDKQALFFSETYKM